MKKLLIQLALPLAVVSISILMAMAMINSRAELPHRESATEVPLVDVMTIEPTNLTIKIRSQGTVKAKQEIDLVSEVSGRVIAVAAEFVAGGQIAANTVLLQIDPIDYEVAIAEAQAALAAAQLRLSEVKVVLMRAAIDEAEAAVKAAKARLRQARADLDNTTITAPFDAIIDSKNVDLGQFVTTGLPMMRLLSTDIAEIRLPILASDIPFIRSTQSSDGHWPKVVFTALRGNTPLHWQGHIARLEQRIDKQTRVSHLVAEVKQPYNHDLHEHPFSVGMFVDAAIEGIEVASAIRIPRSTLHSGNLVYLVENGLLARRKVEILRREQNSLIIQSGLERGDVLVLSRLNLMVEGTAVAPAGN